MSFNYYQQSFADRISNSKKTKFTLRTAISSHKLLLCTIFIIISFSSCKKLVQISPPANSITTSQVFADSVDAAAAISGIYSNILYGTRGISSCNGAQTIFLGLSADELANFSNSNYNQFYFNTLTSDFGNINFYFWQSSYTYLYQVNSCIEQLQNSAKLPTRVQNQFLGEAKFLRSLFYFYLVNIFGDVPLVTSSDYVTNALLARSPKEKVYLQIISDLKEAQNLLRSDYSFSGGNRTRVNKWAVTALLARVYLYTGDWANSEAQATNIISNSGTFNLVSDLNKIFLVNSSESILQWQLNTAYGSYNATAEGASIIPSNSSQPPFFYVPQELLNSFETGDQRKIAWLNSTTYSGTTYYYPYKYKIGNAQSNFNATATEYYMVLRLAEQYLIRAEARAQQNNISGAIADLNVIRARAGGIPLLSSSLTQAQVITAVAHERQIELFAEWGHRWLDLKRTGQVDAVMAIATPLKNGGSAWKSYQQLFPIPVSELSNDPNLTQNPGY